jgi:hypothetical protein
VPDFGTRGLCYFAEDLGPNWDGAPGKYFYILLEEGGFDFGALGGVVFGQEKNGDAERAALLEIETGLLQEPFARNCGGDANPVRGFAVGSYCAAVFETGKSSKGVLENLVRWLNRELRNKTYATGIEVESRVDETVFKVRGRCDFRSLAGRNSSAGCGNEEMKADWGSPWSTKCL